MKSPGHPFAISCAFALGVCPAFPAGVAALKQQAFHRDSSATAVAYSRIIDSHGPYLRLVSGRKNVDILRWELAARVEVPDGIPASIRENADIEPLRHALADLREFSQRYPRSAPLLEKQVAALAAHVGRYDAGEVRFEGEWISKVDLAGIQEARNRQEEAKELAEVENRVFDGSQRDLGLILHDGRWMTRQEIERLSPDTPTLLSRAMEPLWNGDLDGARFAVKNLGDIASSQSGAPKVRTERLQTVVRNLFAAEARVDRQAILHTAEGHKASVHDKNAEKWQQPNAFGTLRNGVARDSLRQAAETRQAAADALATCRRELLDRLHETEGVMQDFSKLREQQVAMILNAAVRAVGGRHFTDADFRPASP